MTDVGPGEACATEAHAKSCTARADEHLEANIVWDGPFIAQR
jgi:hypothetical protein